MAWNINVVSKTLSVNLKKICFYSLAWCYASMYLYINHLYINQFAWHIWNWWCSCICDLKFDFRSRDSVCLSFSNGELLHAHASQQMRARANAFTWMFYVWYDTRAFDNKTLYNWPVKIFLCLPLFTVQHATMRHDYMCYMCIKPIQQMCHLLKKMAFSFENIIVFLIEINMLSIRKWQMK